MESPPVSHLITAQHVKNFIIMFNTHFPCFFTIIWEWEKDDEYNDVWTKNIIIINNKKKHPTKDWHEAKGERGQLYE